jgi:hypothetical protein
MTLMMGRMLQEMKEVAIAAVAATMTKTTGKERVLTSAPVLQRLILLDEAKLIRTLAFDV